MNKGESGLLLVIEAIANQYFDGHFTIMKFTTNWRVSFGCQPLDRDDIQNMPSGETLLEAYNSAMEATPIFKLGMIK